MPPISPRATRCASVVEAVGHADILVNNAGAIPRGDIFSMTEPKWREAWELKVFGYINATRAMLEKMYARKKGAVVNIIGLAGESFNYDYVAGTMGNAGLMAFTRAVGSKSVDHGVRVVAINPPATRTDRMLTLLRGQAEQKFGDPERWPELTKHMPFGRAAEPDEVADLAVFLASDRASYISGVVMTLDGGQARDTRARRRHPANVSRLPRVSCRTGVPPGGTLHDRAQQPRYWLRVSAGKAGIH